MPVYITTPQTKTFYVDESNQGWVLSNTGSIVSANGHGIVNNDAFHDSVITVAGNIVANAMYRDGILSNGSSATIKVEAAGTIHAYSGIAIYGDKTTVQNQGQITAERLGIYVNADDAWGLNDGAINANVGVYFENTHGNSAFGNTGTITADRGFVVQNGDADITLGTKSFIDAKSVGIDLSESSASPNGIANDGLIKSADIAIREVQPATASRTRERSKAKSFWATATICLTTGAARLTMPSTVALAMISTFLAKPNLRSSIVAETTRLAPAIPTRLPPTT